MSLLRATRAYTLTAAAIPIAVSAKLQDRLFTWDALKLLAMGVLSQAGANLVNSYFDYKKGIDTEEHKGDPTIVDGHISLQSCAAVAAGCFLGSGVVALDYMRRIPLFRYVFATGTALGYFYTAPPFHLKYHALGDVVIFFAFGPVLMQAVAIALTGGIDTNLHAYTVPTALLTEAILWAGNTRDIESDAKAGIKTVQMNLGFDSCRKIYDAMIYGAYGICGWLAWQRRSPGLLVPFVTLPGAVQLCSQFVKGKQSMLRQDERTAQHHAPFGILMVLGLIMDDLVFPKLFGS